MNVKEIVDNTSLIIIPASNEEMIDSLLCSENSDFYNDNQHIRSIGTLLTHELLFSASKDTDYFNVMLILMMKNYKELYPKGSHDEIRMVNVIDAITESCNDSSIYFYIYHMWENFQHYCRTVSCSNPNRRYSIINTLCLDSVEGQAFSDNEDINKILAEFGASALLRLYYVLDKTAKSTPRFYNYDISIVYDASDTGSELFFDSIESDIVGIPMNGFVLLKVDEEISSISSWMNSASPYPVVLYGRPLSYPLILECLFLPQDDDILMQEIRNLTNDGKMMIR